MSRASPPLQEEGEIAGHERSPRRLVREAAWLAAILLAVLFASRLEMRSVVPGQGYGSSLALVLLCGWYARRFDVRVPLRSFRPRWAWFPLLAAGAIVAAISLAAAGLDLSPPPLTPAQSIHLILLVPVAEELYFRGLLLEHLRRGVGTWQAVVLCSLLFGMLHLPGGGALTAGGLSLAACALVLLTGGLEYPVALHAAWNAATVLARLDEPSLRWTAAAAASAAVVGMLFGCRSLGRLSGKR